MKLFGLRVFTLLYVSTTLLGCGGGGAYVARDADSNITEVRGVIYSLPKHIVKVSGTANYITKTAVGNDLAIQAPQTVPTDITATVSLHLVGDRDKSYLIDVPRSVVKGRNFKVEVNESGILKSINDDSTGKVGETITNIASIIGKTGAFAVGLDEKADASHFDGLFTEENNKSELLENMAHLPLVSQSYIVNDTTAQNTWKSLVEVNKNIKKFQKVLDKKQKKLLSLKGDPLKSASVDIKVLLEHKALITERKARLEQAFNAGLALYKSGEGIGAVTSSHRFEYELELDELPPSSSFYEGMSVDEIGTAVGDYCNTSTKNKSICDDSGSFYKLWNNFGIVITADNYIGPKISATTGEIEKQDYELFFRYASPISITAYQAREAAEVGNDDQSALTKRLVLVDNKNLNVMHPLSAPYSVGMKSSKFAKHQLIVTTDAMGGLASMQRISTSSLEKATGSVSEALTGLATDYTSISNSIVAIKKQERAEEIAEEKQKVDLLKQRKEFIDQQVAISGAEATQTLLLEKAKLDAELYNIETANKIATAEISQELAVLTNQASQLEANYNIALAQAGNEEKLQLTLLNQRNQLLKAQLQELTNTTGIDQYVVSQAHTNALNQIKHEVSILTNELNKLKTQQQIDQLREEIAAQ